MQPVGSRGSTPRAWCTESRLRHTLQRESDADARRLTRPMTSIIKIGRNSWRWAHADDAGLLVDAADYYHAVYWAINRAQSHVLMSGWQFDSGLPLLRGADVPPGADVRFLKFVDCLCRRRPELRIYLLAWDQKLEAVRSYREYQTLLHREFDLEPSRLMDQLIHPLYHR